MDKLTYLLSFIEGLLTFISPCILPLLPVYVFYLAGETVEKSSDINKLNNKLIYNSIGFVLGFTLIFVILGATATTLGSFLKDNLGVLQKMSGLIMILFGMNFIGIIKLNFLNFEKRLNYSKGKLNFLSSVIFGVVFAFGWSPCGGQFLGAALLTAASKSTVVEGMTLLLAYSSGLAIPFILVAILFDKLKVYIKNLQRHYKLINMISGLILILAGILVLTGNLQYLSYYLSY